MAKTAKQLEVQERYIYNPEIEICPHCGGPLRARPYYLWRKTVQHLDKVVYVASQARECVNPQCDHRGQAYTSAAAQMVTVPECTYGLDVIAQVGWWRDREHLNRQQIHQRLTERGVQISERQVDHLYARYQVLLGCAERLNLPRLLEVVAERGGLILSLDGLEPEGASKQLWVVREVQEDQTLVAGWLPRVNHESLRALLQPVVALALPILATLSDKQPCVVKVLQEVWPEAPHQWRQSHYLRLCDRRHAAQPVYEQDAALKAELRQTIRQGVRQSLGQVLTDAPMHSIAASVFSPSTADRSGRAGYACDGEDGAGP